MTKTYGERLRLALELSKKGRQELASALKISVQALSQVILGKTGSLTAENSARAARFLSVNSYWLATGEGKPHEDLGTDSCDSWPFELISAAEFESLSPQQRLAVEKNFADLVKAFSNKIEKRKFPITKIEEDLSQGKPYVHKTGIIEDDVDVINQNHPDRETGTNERRKRHHK